MDVTSTEAAVTTPETAISITDEEELNEHMRMKLDRRKARNRAAVRSGERRGRIVGGINLENSISLQSITPTTLGRVRKTKSRKSTAKVWG